MIGVGVCDERCSAVGPSRILESMLGSEWFKVSLAMVARRLAKLRMRVKCTVCLAACSPSEQRLRNHSGRLQAGRRMAGGWRRMNGRRGFSKRVKLNTARVEEGDG